MKRSKPTRTGLSRTAVAASLATLVIVLGLRLGAAWFGQAESSPALLTPDEGPYLIGLQPGETADRVVAVARAGAGAAVEVAVLPHLPGYTARGAVSPDGRYLAVVIATAGTPAQPAAELLVVDLWNGRVRSLAGGLPYLQDPVWANDGGSVVVTREPAPGTVELLRVDLGGRSAIILRREGVLGVYPVGFTPAGVLYAVLIDARGSTLLRGTEEVRQLAPGITRDWALSPDGGQLAFVEYAEGRYLGRIVSLEPGAVSAQAAAVDDGRQRLGPAWDPRTGRAVFAEDPAPADGAAAAQAAGIDRPLAFAPDGSALAVEHWDGTSFAEPGRPQVQVLRDGERIPIPVTRVFGWSVP